jgi:hypothetical protein
VWNVLRRRSRAKPDPFDDTVRDLRRRAELLGTRQLAYGESEVIHAIAAFVHVLGKAIRTAERFTIALIGLTVVTVTLIVFQIYDAHNAATLQTGLNLDAEFFNNPNNLAVISAIEGGSPILKSNKGAFSETQLDHYLGQFEPIYEAYNDHSLRERDLCNYFSYYVVETYETPEIAAYVRLSRKENPLYYEGFERLYKVVKGSKDPLCH